MPDSKDKNEKYLMQCYQESGDLKFLGLLFKDYVHLVYGVCLKYLKHREDSQEATMQIFEKLSHDLRNNHINHFKSWLYTVTKNHCYNRLHIRNAIPPLEPNTDTNYEEYMKFESFFSLNNDEDKRTEEEHRLYACMENLLPQQKESILLFYDKQKCYREISEILNVSTKKVKSYLQNGKQNIKKCLS